MKFTKMQGCGNDYVYINCFEQEVQNPTELAQKMSNRNFGIGSDGLILVMPSQVADCKMRMFNSDGSESEMCGNGIRCVGKFVHDKNIVKKDIITVETLAGIKTLQFFKDENDMVLDVKVNMGEPIFKADLIPVISEEKDLVKNLTLTALDKTFTFTCLSMGNPHAVTFVDDVDNFDVDKYGSILEKHPAFPKKANIEFVQIINKNHLKMRVFERGSGETFACGTGTCATVVASFLNDKSDRTNVKVDLLGGSLNISWDEKDNNVYMTGPARFVFEGEWLL